MIGIIISGHANFATGLNSSLELIAGKQAHVKTVDFLEGNSSEDLTANLKAAINSIENCDKYLIFTDLIGGSPFKLSVELKYELANEKEIEVISGTNLGMIIETSMMATASDDLNSLIESAINTGKSQVYKFELPQVNKEEIDEEDGI